MDGYEGMITVRCALRLAPRVFVRPGELRRAEWKDIDFEAAEWRYTVTKTKTPHSTPLTASTSYFARTLSDHWERPLCFPWGARSGTTYERQRGTRCYEEDGRR